MRRVSLCYTPKAGDRKPPSKAGSTASTAVSTDPESTDHRPPTTDPVSTDPESTDPESTVPDPESNAEARALREEAARKVKTTKEIICMSLTELEQASQTMEAEKSQLDKLAKLVQKSKRVLERSGVNLGKNAGTKSSSSGRGEGGFSVEGATIKESSTARSRGKARKTSPKQTGGDCPETHTTKLSPSTVEATPTPAKCDPGEGGSHFAGVGVASYKKRGQRVAAEDLD